MTSFYLGTSEQSLEDSLREQKVSWLGKQDFRSEEARSIFEELKADEKANQVQVRMARLGCLDFDKKFSFEPSQDQKEKAEEAMEICKEVSHFVKAFCYFFYGCHDDLLYSSGARTHQDRRGAGPFGHEA